MNGAPISASKQTRLDLALIATEYSADTSASSISTKLGNVERLLSHPCRGIRSVGSAASSMCLVAAGAVDAYYEHGIHCWDIAAAYVIAGYNDNRIRD